MSFDAKIGLAVAVFALGFSFVALFAPYEWRRLPTSVTRFGLSIGVLLLVVAIGLCILLPDEKRPDVTLRFVNPDNPLAQLQNTSQAAATNVKFVIAAFNITTSKLLRAF
jgi:hypothetical protein